MPQRVEAGPNTAMTKAAATTRQPWNEVDRVCAATGARTARMAARPDLDRRHVHFLIGAVVGADLPDGALGRPPLVEAGGHHEAMAGSMQADGQALPSGSHAERWAQGSRRQEYRAADAGGPRAQQARLARKGFIAHSTIPPPSLPGLR
jgi:hypothetical protein